MVIGLFSQVQFFYFSIFHALSFSLSLSCSDWIVLSFLRCIRFTSLYIVQNGSCPTLFHIDILFVFFLFSDEWNLIFRCVHRHLCSFSTFLPLSFTEAGRRFDQLCHVLCRSTSSSSSS